jgi:hypothetical protein
MVFEFGDIERARYHAESAAHAFFGPPDHRAEMGFIHGICQAGSGASWLPAVHALFFDKDVSFLRFITVDYHPLCLARGALFFQRPDILDIGDRKIMGFGAGNLTGPTTNTPCCIHKNANKFYLFRALLSFSRFTCKG